MWMSTGSVWGPGLGVLPKKHQEQHKEHGLGHGQEGGGNLDPLQSRVKGRSSPGVVDFKKSSGKAPECPQGGCRGHREHSRLNWPCPGDHKLLQQGAECLWILLAPLESEHPGSHTIKPFGSNRFDFFFLYFFFFSRAAMTCHVKAFY